MSALTRTRRRGGGVPARRAVMRWGWRLFRREWHQQLLVLGLLAVAVAATVWGACVVTNTQLPSATYARFGTASAMATLPGSDPALTADVAAIADRWGPADVIETQRITPAVQLRAERPRGHYDAPLLALVDGSYPAGAGQVALTAQVASRYGVQVGGTWQPAAGSSWRVSGIVANPSNLADQFALVAPGQIARPSQVSVLLGPAAAQAASGGTLPGVQAAAVSFPDGFAGGISPAVGVLLAEGLGLAFIGLLAVASFSVMAQRRIRALAMLSAIGATERQLRLVLVANGLVTGAAGAAVGTALGLAAWFGYAPALQRDTGHVVNPAHLPWWAPATAAILAIAMSALAARHPAKSMARVPVVAALSGRPAPARAKHRSIVPASIVFAIGLALLALSDGLNAVDGGGGSNGTKHALLLLAGLIATITGICLLAPLAISVLAAGASHRLPAAIRIALRDLVRYRARSGAALAATTFAVFLGMSICIAASVKFDDPLDWTGPNLASNQLIVPTQTSPGPGQIEQLSGTQLAALSGAVNGLAASLHARSAVPLETASTLYQAGAQPHGPQNFTGTVFVATPRLLATYGIKASQIAPGTDVLTMRPGLAALPRMELIWDSGCTGRCAGSPVMPGTSGGPPCTLSNQCLPDPVIATIASLPGGTSAPNTLVTQNAVRKYHLQPQLSAWLIQAPAPLTAAQLSTVRQFGRSYGVSVQTRTGNPSLGDFAAGATALGLLIALSVLAMSVGLIRSETAPDLRTLTATGASRGTRRMITAATAAALGLLGAVLGLAGAVLAGMAWTRSGPSATAGGVPLLDIVTLLAGLPLIAAAGGWLLAGREPEAISRQPLQ